MDLVIWFVTFHVVLTFKEGFGTTYCAIYKGEKVYHPCKIVGNGESITHI
jgi:hypothetical protein